MITRLQLSIAWLSLYTFRRNVTEYEISTPITTAYNIKSLNTSQFRNTIIHIIHFQLPFCNRHLTAGVPGSANQLLINGNIINSCPLNIANAWIQLPDNNSIKWAMFRHRNIFIKYPPHFPKEV